MPVLSLEAMCPSQCCWAKISVAAGLVLLEGSGGKPILASSVSRAGLCLCSVAPPSLTSASLLLFSPSQPLCYKDRPPG